MEASFLDHVRAAFPALWVQTVEPKRAVIEYSREAKKKGYKAYSWDIIQGIKEVEGPETHDLQDPVAAIDFLRGRQEMGLLFLYNFHRFLRPGSDGATEIIQQIMNVSGVYKAESKTLVVVSPTVDIPTELEKTFTVIRFELPDKETLRKTLVYMADSTSRPLPDDGVVDAMLEAGKGLTASEYENAIALSLITKRAYDPEVITEQKKQLIRKSGSLVLEDTDETLENLGGMEVLKSFCTKVIKSALSKGVLLLGVPGTGKSHFSKGLGKSEGVATAAMDFGRMFGSMVGESEERIRSALEVVDAFSPCVLRIDEIEKGLSGIKSSGSTDGGTGSRVFSTFLNWLNDHKSKVFVVATCNDISQMPPEFLRAERWDAIFFVDLPNAKERETIFQLYKKQYQVKGNPPNMAGWSGAEIKSLCRIASMMNVPLEDAAAYVMPLSKSMSDKIEGLREWAKTRTIPASIPEQETTKEGRRIVE